LRSAKGAFPKFCRSWGFFLNSAYAPQTLDQFVNGVLDAQVKLLPLLRVDPAFMQQLSSNIAELRRAHGPHKDATERGRRLTDAGNWRIHVLYNVSGQIGDMSDDTLTTRPKQFNGDAYPALRRLFDTFGAHMTNFHITTATPGARLVVHVDPMVFPAETTGGALDCGNRQLLLRMHVPVVTSEADFAIFGGEKRYYESGTLYYFNALHPHCAANGDDLDRVHLVLDMWLTEALWQSVLNPHGETAAPDGFSRLTQQERVAILTRQDQPAEPAKVVA
jgi:hypothetical protein